MSSAGAYSAIDGSAPTPFTTGTTYPSTAIANNLLFAVNGQDKKKTNGTVVTNFGIAAPTLTSAVDSGVAGNPSGTYRIALTSYNSATGHESSRGNEIQVVVVGKKITATWTFPTDTQVTHIRVHIFKVGLTDRFFRLTNTNVTPNAGSYDSAAGGYSSATTSVTIDVTDADINNLIIATPSQTENNPPPTGTKFIAYHGSRMWATDGNLLYYSKLGDPESFDPQNFERVGQGDGQDIVGFISLVDHQMVILKSGSAHLLTGPDDPNTWEVAPIDTTVGCAAARSIVASEGKVWWQAFNGIYTVEFSELASAVTVPRRVDSPYVSEYFESLLAPELGTVCSLYHQQLQRVLFAVPTSGSGRNSNILPKNLIHDVWEDIWDPVDVSAFGQFRIENKLVPVIGGYAGRVSQLWTLPYVDGVRTIDAAGNQFTLSGTVKGVTEQIGIDQIVKLSTSAFSTLNIFYAGVESGEWLSLFAADRSSFNPTNSSGLTSRSAPGSGASMTLFDSNGTIPGPGGALGNFEWFTSGDAAAIGFGLKKKTGFSIAFDAAAARAYGSTLTWSHTCAGGADSILLVVVRDDTAVNNTAVTYNGVAMSLLTEVFITPGFRYTVWALANPAAGAHNVAVTGPANIAGCSASYLHVASVTPVNSLTDTAATFDTANDALIEVPVVAVSPTGVAYRNVIISNTSTVLTLLNNWSVLPQPGWQYYVGSPNFEFDTKHVHPTSVPGQEGSVFMERTWKDLLVKAYTDTTASVLDAYAMLNGDVDMAEPTHMTIVTSSGGAQWDVDLWDVGKFGFSKVATKHVSLGRSGRTCGIRFRNARPGEGVVLLGVGLMGSELNHKE